MSGERGGEDEAASREHFAGPEAQTLNRLVETLRWDDGPRALRVVLPLARLARRGGAMMASGRASGGPARPVAVAAPPPRRRLSRRILAAGYRLTRPVVLPLAVRLHKLLTRLLQREAMLSHASGEAASAPAATAELLRSMESALLTLALRPRERG
jgi:hypothetical protein